MTTFSMTRMDMANMMKSIAVDENGSDARAGSGIFFRRSPLAPEPAPELIYTQRHRRCRFPSLVRYSVSFEYTLLPRGWLGQHDTAEITTAFDLLDFTSTEEGAAPRHVRDWAVTTL